MYYRGEKIPKEIDRQRTNLDKAVKESYPNNNVGNVVVERNPVVLFVFPTDKTIYQKQMLMFIGERFVFTYTGNN